MFDIPDIFWIFAGITLVILASGYAKGMKTGAAPQMQSELNAIKERLDRIEHHLELNN
jgi:hypothetical protein